MQAESGAPLAPWRGIRCGVRLTGAGGYDGISGPGRPQPAAGPVAPSVGARFRYATDQRPGGVRSGKYMAPALLPIPRLGYAGYVETVRPCVTATALARDQRNGTSLLHFRAHVFVWALHHQDGRRLGRLSRPTVATRIAIGAACRGASGRSAAPRRRRRAGRTRPTRASVTQEEPGATTIASSGPCRCRS